MMDRWTERTDARENKGGLFVVVCRRVWQSHYSTVLSRDDHRNCVLHSFIRSFQIQLWQTAHRRRNLNPSEFVEVQRLLYEVPNINKFFWHQSVPWNLCG